MRTLRKYNIKGFSLIELMVVVAIIGILSAIAIPNFNRFQRKARQSEAKSSLGGLYTAEKAFMAEWETYASNLPSIGLSLDGQLRYDTGFTLMHLDVGGIGGYTGVIGDPASFNTGASCQSGTLTEMRDCASPVQIGDTVTLTTATTFTAGAEGSIGGTDEDRWTIDQAKAVNNVQSGL